MEIHSQSLPLQKLQQQHGIAAQATLPFAALENASLINVPVPLQNTIPTKYHDHRILKIKIVRIEPQRAVRQISPISSCPVRLFCRIRNERFPYVHWHILRFLVYAGFLFLTSPYFSAPKIRFLCLLQLLQPELPSCARSSSVFVRNRKLGFSSPSLAASSP